MKPNQPTDKIGRANAQLFLDDAEMLHINFFREQSDGNCWLAFFLRVRVLRIFEYVMRAMSCDATDFSTFLVEAGRLQ